MTKFVIKRNQKVQKFNFNKIVNAVSKAFEASGIIKTKKEIEELCRELEIENYSTIESIQNKVEDLLMKNNYFLVAKKYILYRYNRANDRELSEVKDFITDYMVASNAATGSKYDANSNVVNKNVTTLNGEIFKKKYIDLNRSRMKDKLNQLYGTEKIQFKFGNANSYADEYIRMLNHKILYKHDEVNPIYPYCVAITLYPMLINGLQDLGGISNPPKHLRSFCGIFVNLMFTIAAQFAGAVATPEFLMYFDYYCRKEWGDDYYLHLDKIVEFNKESTNGNSIEYVMKQYLQNIVYYLNQPAAARNFQSIFWNIGYFDKKYFEGIFGDFVFPDGTKPSWDSLNFMQKFFMKWFNHERTIKILTFPVETMAMLTDGNDIVDKEYADFTAEMYSEGHSFFTYLSDSPDSLSSCCRLRNEVADNQFSYSLGAGGVATGSKSVMTLNINRLVQDAVKNNWNILEYLREQILKIHKFQTAYNEILKDFYKNHMLTVYDAGFITLEKQYLTLGINGMVESAEFLGLTISPNEDYQNYVSSLLQVFYEENKKARTKELMFNTEFVPAENLGVKFAKWDKEDGYFVPRDCYNSYFYVVEDESLSVLDKFKLHGKDFVKYLDGGSALHCNLDEHLTKEQYRHLLQFASQEGTNYFTFNIPNTVCKDCGHISKHNLKQCPECHSENLAWATRVIGYLKLIENFSEARQKEALRRLYHNPKNENL